MDAFAFAFGPGPDDDHPDNDHDPNCPHHLVDVESLSPEERRDAVSRIGTSIKERVTAAAPSIHTALDTAMSAVAHEDWDIAEGELDSLIKTFMMFDMAITALAEAKRMERKATYNEPAIVVPDTVPEEWGADENG